MRPTELCDERLTNYLVRSELCPYIWAINEPKHLNTMKNAETTKEAVERSISHDTITWIEASDKAEARALIAELEAIAAESDLDVEWTDSNEGYETWAMVDGSVNGGPMAWRVHIAVVAQ